jgi:hypothetical protein
MNPRVKSVKAIQDYKLDIVFDSNEEKIFDCSSLLNFGVFKELQDEEYFKQVQCKYGTVAWPHEQDICPDTLYLNSKKI